jgi:type I site-specific restriction endonuclease
MNEAETRAEHIDPALKAAGWGVVDGSRIRREKSAYEITPRSHSRAVASATRPRLPTMCWSTAT